MSESSDLVEKASVVVRGVSWLAQRLRAERPRDGTTLSMLSALSHLYREGAMTAGRLAVLQRTTPQTLTRTLTRLEEEGLVTRSPGISDRRLAVLELTRDGLDRFLGDVRPRVEWLAQAMTSLSPAEQGILCLAATLMEQLATWDFAEPVAEDDAGASVQCPV